MRYRVNERDEIDFVDDEWIAVARELAGSRVSPEEVMNRPIWDFISDPTTCQLYLDAFHKVRAGRVIAFPFRCDTPALRRVLQMRIQPLDRGHLELETHILLVEARKPVELLLPAGPTLRKLVRMCGWCKKIDIGSQTWVEAEEAISHLQLFDHPQLPMLSHGICPPCLVKMTAELG